MLLKKKKNEKEKEKEKNIAAEYQESAK